MLEAWRVYERKCRSLLSDKLCFPDSCIDIELSVPSFLILLFMSDNFPQPEGIVARQYPTTTSSPPIDDQTAILVQALTSSISGIAVITVLLLVIINLARKRRLVAADYAVATVLILDCGTWAESLVAVNDHAGYPTFRPNISVDDSSVCSRSLTLGQSTIIWLSWQPRLPCSSC